MICTVFVLNNGSRSGLMNPQQPRDNWMNKDLDEFYFGMNSLDCSFRRMSVDFSPVKIFSRLELR